MNKTHKQTLMCDLTDKERRDYGITLATTLGDMEDIEAQKKREMDHFKDRIAGLQAKADELSRKVRDGKEWREVECHTLMSTPDREHKQTIRLDTGETIRTERMTDTDLQIIMPFEEGDDSGNEEEDADGSGDVVEVEEVVYRDADEEGEQDDSAYDEAGGHEDFTLSESNRYLADYRATPAGNRESWIERMITKVGEVRFQIFATRAKGELPAAAYKPVKRAAQELAPAEDY